MCLVLSLTRQIHWPNSAFRDYLGSVSTTILRFTSLMRHCYTYRCCLPSVIFSAARCTTPDMAFLSFRTWRRGNRNSSGAASCGRWYGEWCSSVIFTAYSTSNVFVPTMWGPFTMYSYACSFIYILQVNLVKLIYLSQVNRIWPRKKWGKNVSQEWEKRQSSCIT